MEKEAHEVKVLLIDLEPALCDAWRASFAGEGDVRVHFGDFRSQLGQFDCFVSPANAFGLMDGGIDATILDVFGAALEERVQEAIWREYRGEQPVGTSLLVPTGDPRCPWLAHCPTMRLPANVSESHHAYAAFLAALTTAGAAHVKTLACPGLGTLTGRIPSKVAARQMRYAYDVWRGPRRSISWDYAEGRLKRSFGGSQS